MSYEIVAYLQKFVYLLKLCTYTTKFRTLFLTNFMINSLVLLQKKIHEKKKRNLLKVNKLDKYGQKFLYFD